MSVLTDSLKYMYITEITHSFDIDHFLNINNNIKNIILHNVFNEYKGVFSQTQTYYIVVNPKT